MLRNDLSYNLEFWCMITRMCYLIWVSIQDFQKKSVFLAENAINENARFSEKNGLMTFVDPQDNEVRTFFDSQNNGVMTFFDPQNNAKERKIHLPDPVPR